MTDAEKASQEMFENWEDLVKEADKSRRSVASVQLVLRTAESLRGVRHITVNAKKALLQESLSAVGPAKDAPVTLTLEGEIYKRFSAYANDRRVTVGRGLTSGTFATTKEDAEAYVKTGTNAVHRYALENKTPASNVFTITPPKETNLQRALTASSPSLQDVSIQVRVVTPLLLLILCGIGGAIGGTVAFWADKAKDANFVRVLIGVVTGFVLYWALLFGVVHVPHFPHAFLLNPFSAVILPFFGGWGGTKVITLILKQFGWEL